MVSRKLISPVLAAKLKYHEAKACGVLSFVVTVLLEKLKLGRAGYSVPKVFKSCVNKQRTTEVYSYLVFPVQVATSTCHGTSNNEKDYADNKIKRDAAASDYSPAETEKARR